MSTQAQVDAMAATVRADVAELASIRAAAGSNPTTAQRDSIAVMQGRIAAAQSALQTLISELPVIYSPIPLPAPFAPAPSAPVSSTPSPITSTPVTSPSSPSTPAAPVIYSPIPLPAPLNPTPSAPVSSTPSPPSTGSPIPGGILSPITLPSSLPDLSNLDAAFILSSGAVGSAAAQSASEGWDYWRQIIGGDFTEAEYLFNDIAGSVIDAGTAVSFVEVGAGVTADVAALEPVGFAAALLLGEYAFGWILTKVSLIFPNPSIFGWHPLNFIVSGINNFGKQFEGSAKGLGDTLANVFIQPIRQILGLFQRSGNATAAAHNKVAHLHNSTIPQAQKSAIATAGAYTDQQITQLTVDESNKIAALQHDVATQIAQAKASIAADVKTASDRANAALVAALQGDEVLLASLATTVNTEIPLEIAAQINQATATENQRLTATAAQLQGEIDAVQGEIAALSSQVASAQSTIATARQQIATLEAQSTVDQSAVDALQGLIATQQQEIATSTTAIADLNNTITGISSTLAPVRAAQQLNTYQLAPFEAIGAVALPTLLATMATQLNKLQTKVDTCVVTTCDPTSPQNLKNQLMNLLSMLSAAGELAFIAEAIRDPEGTASTLQPSLEGIETGAFDTLNALLSL